MMDTTGRDRIARSRASLRAPREIVFIALAERGIVRLLRMAAVVSPFQRKFCGRFVDIANL